MDQPRIVTWKWRLYFDDSIISLAKKLLQSGHLVRFSTTRGEDPSASGEFMNGYRCKCKAPASYAEASGEFSVSDTLPPDVRKQMGLRFFSCNCQDSSSFPCPHEAAVLMHWEKERGSFNYRETAAEKARRESAEQNQQSSSPVYAPILPVPEPVSRASAPTIASFYDDVPIPDHLFFDPTPILQRVQTTEAALRSARSLLSLSPVLKLQTSITYPALGPQQLTCKVSSSSFNVRFTLDPERITRMSCSTCHTNYTDSKTVKAPVFCSHALVAYRKVLDYLIRFRPGDSTDRSGNTLISELVPGQGKNKYLPNRQETVDLQACLRFQDNHAPDLTIRLRQDKTSFHECSHPLDIIDYSETRKTCFLTTGAIDFGKNTLRPSSMPLYTLLSDESNRMAYEYKMTGLRFSHETAYGLSLYGRLLDRFYDMHDGSSVPVLDKPDEVTGRIAIGTRPGMIPVTLTVSEQNDQPVLLLEGNMPSVLYGDDHVYLLERKKTCLSRISPECLKLCEILTSLSDDEGNFRCTFGQSQIMYFCRSLLPTLESFPLIRLMDYTPDGFLDDMSVPASFEFYLTFEKTQRRNNFVCSTIVRYGQNRYQLPYLENVPDIHDAMSEELALSVVRRYFPDSDDEKAVYLCPESTDTMYVILHDALPELEKLGKVYASEDFPDLHIKKPGDFSFRIDVDGTILNLSLLSDDLDQEELLALVQSYRLKAHFHRLRSGEFVDMDTIRDQLDTVMQIASDIDVRPEDIINSTARMPQARAYLIDALLEKHQVPVSHDDVFRTLLEKMDHMRDVTHKAPAHLSSVMRPYQVLGFNWMLMLISAGFGGILADDMGLGKTLQMLSVLYTLREEGAQLPFLIVCPASLVYNWQEEARRFTPSLSCTPLTGTLAAREIMLSDLRDRKMPPSDIYIASYDIVRRDIFALKDIPFEVVVLDEAQYIKTGNSAVTKAVKLLDAKHRFALTGTPIENRLSELWSIFDFLMPGFLFSYPAFRERFEIPVSQEQDPEATELLTRMTAPFILRRLKTDVLKDLPEKLEEIHTAVFSGEQRKLYNAQALRVMHLIHDADNPQERFNVLSEILKLRQICCDPSLLYESYSGESAKRSACMDLIRSAIEGGHRMLVFSQFTSMLELLAGDLTSEKIPYFMLTGSTSKEERLRLVHDFNVKDVPVFLISLKAGGTGLNLVGADVVIHYDPWWNLAAQNQATDRAHRIGQTRQVTVFKLIAAGTIEERILELQDKKKDLADAILEGRGESLLTLSKDELISLLGSGLPDGQDA